MLHVDVRTIPPRDRHPTIFGMLAELAAGDALEITSDHDPRPLRLQLEREHPERFSWSYRDSGPELWLVRIERVAPAG